ncbi:MAG: hypothetical protein HZC36_03045 [Armatimonadetes bacterium]|nr:hypothetical protein [Armatimonadota bacterium]
MLKCNGEPSLYWYNGYMCDFPAFLHGTDEGQASAIVDFLQDFFGDRIVCGVVLNEEGKSTGGGPIAVSDLDQDAWWSDPMAVVRSWTGKADLF